MPASTPRHHSSGMLGETVYHGAAGSIGPRHVTHGSFLLLQYDLVVDLEADGGHDTLDDVIFRGVGWPNTLRNVGAVGRVAIEFAPLGRGWASRLR